MKRFAVDGALALFMIGQPVAGMCADAMPIARATVASAASPAASTWPAVRRMADAGQHQYSALRTGTFAGTVVAYRAELSEFVVRDRSGHRAASMYATSFVATGAQPVARPVLFLFNGGPGGSSNTLMFGAVGPKRLKVFSPAAMADPATPVIDNPETVLDCADIVFIDAPETGFGRPLPGADPRTFRSNDGDSSAFTQVILRWLHDHDRNKSPIYLAGESYGSIRAALLARDLRAATPRVELTGIILISEALQYNGPASGTVKRIDNPLRAINGLPDIAALSWYHGLIENRTQTLEQAVRAAQAYALTDYATAILSGNRLADADHNRVAATLARLTGLSAGTWLAKGLQLEDPRKELLAGRDLALGQFDGRETERLTGVVEDARRDFTGMMRALTLASESAARDVFQARDLPPYRSIVDDPFGFEKTWTFVQPPAAGADVVLREQMMANPSMRLMVTQGVFDTTTPMGTTDYLFGQFGLPRTRITIAYYPGGHMLYSDDAGRTAFLQDMRAFVSGKVVGARPFPSPRPATGA